MEQSNQYASAVKLLKIHVLAICRNKKLLSDTVLIPKMRKSRSERELLNLGKLFRKPSIILMGGFYGNSELQIRIDSDNRAVVKSLNNRGEELTRMTPLYNFINDVPA